MRGSGELEEHWPPPPPPEREYARTPGVVGMVHVTCPACAENVETDVRVKSVAHEGGSYIAVAFRAEHPKHECNGRRH